MCDRTIVTNPNREESKVCPIYRIEIIPVLNIGEYHGSTEEVDEIEDCLQHEGALGHGKLELFLITAGVSSPYIYQHERGNEKIQSGSEYSIVVCLGESVGFGWR